MCGILLALNFYYRPEPPKPAPVDSGDSSAVSESTTSPLSSQETSAPKDGVEIKGNGLVTQAPVEAIGENIETLTTYNAEGQPEVEFAITSHGGGIKTATMLNQLAVGATSKKVILNEHSPAPIGSICHSPDGYLNLYYDIVKDGNAIFCQATTPDGVQITKKWALVQDDEKPGAPWSINLTITMTNQGKGMVILPNFSLFAGSASPLHPDEWENQGGAYYLNNGSLTNKDSSWFKKGFFRNARQLFSESVEELEYAGVSNQFFTTLIRPSGKYAATVWAKAGEVRIPGDNPERPKYAVRSGFTFPDVEVDPGELANFSYQLYVGPKAYGVLKKMETDTSEVMNYGWFTPISVLLNNVLNWLHNIAFSKTADKWSWGLSIIALTILIRIAIWPLHNKSTRTMKRMSKLQPMMKDLREKYKDNPNKLNQETMKLYKSIISTQWVGACPCSCKSPFSLVTTGCFSTLSSCVARVSFGWMISPCRIPSMSCPLVCHFLVTRFPLTCFRS